MIGLFLVSCSPLIPATTYGVTIDFTKYANENFLITPTDYPGKYKSVNEFDIYFFPAAKHIDAYNATSNKGYHMEGQYIVKNLMITQIVDSVYKLSKEMGADAIMYFKINRITKTDISGYEISG